MSARARERILWSMVCSVAENGYEAATVDDAIERARISRDAFEEHFSDKYSCVLAAYDWVVEEAVSRVSPAYEAGAAISWPEGVRRGLEALLEAIAEWPEGARMAALEMPPLGPDAHQRYRQAVDRFAAFTEQGSAHSHRGEELYDRATLMALGGAEVILFDEIAAGRAEGLPKLLPEILFAVLVPYLGPEEAAAEMHAAGAPAG